MSPSRRQKLQMLTRSIARGDIKTANDLLRADGPAPARPAPPEPLRLEEACPGCETPLTTPLGPGVYWHIRRPLHEIDDEASAIDAQYAAVLKGARQVFDELEASAALCHVADARPQDLLFMDLETCGFAGSPIFLVGVMGCCDGRLVVEQMLARDYSEEGAILHAFAGRYDSCGVLVTFNGKAYDLNMIRERAAFHAVEMPFREPPHLDLLHESRRRWKRDLPNCRLQTLEAALCGRRRVGDIPGAMIPDAYHRFVETRDARQLRDILHHNLLDLLTMAQLVCALLTSSGPAET